MVNKTIWNSKDIYEFCNWHENTIERNNYPDKLKAELRVAREKWLYTLTVKPKE